MMQAKKMFLESPRSLQPPGYKLNLLRMLLFAVPLKYKIGWIAQHVFGQLVFAACNSNLPWYHDIPQQLHKTDNIC